MSAPEVAGLEDTLVLAGLAEMATRLLEHLELAVQQAGGEVLAAGAVVAGAV
jgi:hypothetical protein